MTDLRKNKQKKNNDKKNKTRKLYNGRRTVKKEIERKRQRK